MVFHLYQDLRNEWRWYLAAPNGAKLAVATRGYAHRSECVSAISHMKSAVDAPTTQDDNQCFADLTFGARLAYSA